MLFAVLAGFDQVPGFAIMCMEIREASTSAAALSSVLEAMAVEHEGDFDGLILGTLPHA